MSSSTATPTAKNSRRSSPRRSRIAPARSDSPTRPASASNRSPEEGTGRIVRAAIEYAIANNRDSVTLVHKGNIMKFTEGAFRDWGYALAKREYGATDLDGGPWQVFKRTDKGSSSRSHRGAFLQQILLRPAEYEVIATLNLNGDYISDALAGPRGGIGIARAATSTTTPGTPSSRPPTAPRRSTPGRTRSTPAR
ncbi:MAG: hypothetical protein CM1200mP34_4960 [Verrucomicrobiales bacterium]|nr:MAG: hypothetical protein CM1200mP34_4960 [Verrucomicrobiales bacterium]